MIMDGWMDEVLTIKCLCQEYCDSTEQLIRILMERCNE